MTDSAFGANAWLVEELYKQYQTDKNSVDESWWPVMEKVAAAGGDIDKVTGASSASQASKPASAPSQAQPTTAPANSGPAATTGSAAPTANASVAAKTTNQAPRTTPIPADAPKVAPKGDVEAAEDVITPLKGVARTISKNMDASLSIPTATSVRTIPAKLMIDNRIVINNHLRRTRGGKVSFTHLIGWALIKTLKQFPSQNVAYTEVDGKPALVTPAHIGLGIAIDLPKPDGSRQLMVPAIKQAETLNFNEYLAAYEDLVKRARAGKLTATDFQGATISLTNPGGIGTVHSIPRLMNGQGCIVGAGALEYPAQYQGAAAETLANLGVSKTITLTSTYDHRVIQGAGSGEFLKIVHEHLIGQHEFYEEIFAALRLPYAPVKWATDIHIDSHQGNVDKNARVQELVNSFRVRGHLMADIDPLEYQQHTHPDLEIENHGLTFWDLDREFVAGGIGGRNVMKLRDILGVMRDSYCRKIGIEYMHIQDPEQRLWLRDQLERPYEKPGKETQMRILEKLNEAEAFETFLQTKYVGQKRFSLEGGESLIPLLDAMLIDAAEDGVESVDIGMAHRGRLSVLSNIAGKSYGQIFREFEGSQSEAGASGDVKYHLGASGVFTAPNGTQVPIHLAANPSHLEVVNGVLSGIVRAKQDLKPIGSFATLPVLVHGDAAFSGQGIVYEVLQMSQLRGYRTGGTIHIIVNNQVGFTTLPIDSRSSVYSTDVGKTVQTPIFHVNGDDPESVVRVAELAFRFRQKFHKDVIIDLVCYRRRGHNEGDDPSMTQPMMTSLIEAKRSTRKLYTEALVGRGDITEEQYEQAKLSFRKKLEQAFDETHVAQTGVINTELEKAKEVPSLADADPVDTAVSTEVIEKIGDAHLNKPDGFTVHPKLEQLIQKRAKMSRDGGIDWGFGEILALGSLLLEGTPVRFAGQDARRGTFAQRHAAFHDYKNGQEWLPLLNLSEDQARFWIYDSLLSEYAALAYEYGYSLQREDALVIWEAQFGDFANGAQTVVDEFISSAEQKWGQSSSVVMLLPHGYEGQGPDHSSARIERYLQMCAQENMIVARPSTPANHFHLLRRQAYQRPRKPLIVFSPKSMLRLRGATSGVAEFTQGRFRPVIGDNTADATKVKRVLLTAGKVYYDLKNEIAKQGEDRIAIVRLEQFYPLPETELLSALERYRGAEFVWVQDEPENQGAWPFLQNKFRQIPTLAETRVVSRPEAASPSTGSAKVHAVEQEQLIAAATSL